MVCDLAMALTLSKYLSDSANILSPHALSHLGIETLIVTMEYFPPFENIFEHGEKSEIVIFLQNKF